MLDSNTTLLSRIYGVVSVLVGLTILTGCDKNPTDAKGPAAPSALETAVASISSIDLSWTDNADDEEGFLIERRSSASDEFSQIGEVGADVTTYTNAELTISTTYYYRVCAYHSEGNSGHSNVVEATISYGKNVGNIAVDFTAEDQNNSDVSLYDFSGQVILVNFAADW